MYILKGFARCRQSLKLYCNKTYLTHGCLLDLGPHNSGNLATWRGVSLTLLARGRLFWRHQASDFAYMVPDWAQFGHQIEV